MLVDNRDRLDLDENRWILVFEDLLSVDFILGKLERVKVFF